MASSKLWLHGSRIVRHVLQPGRPVGSGRYFVEYVPCEKCGSAIVRPRGLSERPLCSHCALEDRMTPGTGRYYEDAVAFILIVGAAIVLLLWWLA